MHTRPMWHVAIAAEFEPELRAFDVEVRTEILSLARLVEQFGPTLGRPRVDTLKGSRHANMKELRFDAAGAARRRASAFDPARRAILLIAGSKSGVSEKRFYRQLITRADKRYSAHLDRLRGPGKPKQQ